VLWFCTSPHNPLLEPTALGRHVFRGAKAAPIPSWSFRYAGGHSAKLAAQQIVIRTKQADRIRTMWHPSDEMKIRFAIDSDSKKLTAISYAAKRFWPYPMEYFGIWEDELTITPEYIRNNVVCLAEVGNETVGFYSIIEPQTSNLNSALICNLDHIYVQPEFIGKKIGSTLFEHAKALAKQKGYGELMAFVDPNAKGFYEKMAAKYLHDIPSNIPGRNIPVFRIECK
jgi:GNAT superfamily N-acetyltransferase